MKKITGFVLSLILSHSVHAADMAEIVKNVKDVCLSPSQQGKYWNVTATGGAKADGAIKLIAAGINGQATFTKAEWQGVQQALQPKENADYRDCVEKLTPLFVSKFSAATPTAKSKSQPAKKTSSASHKSTVAAKPATTSAKPAAPESETTNTVIGDQNVTGNNAGGDMNINFGTKP